MQAHDTRVCSSTHRSEYMLCELDNIAQANDAHRETRNCMRSTYFNFPKVDKSTGEFRSNSRRKYFLIKIRNSNTKALRTHKIHVESVKLIFDFIRNF